MKTKLGWVALAGAFGSAALLSVSCGKSAERALDEVYNNLDLQKNTKLHVEEYWKGINGKDFTAAGRVVDVQRDREGAEVFVAVPSRITFHDYNLVLVVPDVAAAADLNRRQDVKFKGFLSNYKAERYGGAVLYMRGVEILK